MISAEIYVYLFDTSTRTKRFLKSNVGVARILLIWNLEKLLLFNLLLHCVGFSDLCYKSFIKKYINKSKEAINETIKCGQTSLKLYSTVHHALVQVELLIEALPYFLDFFPLPTHYVTLCKEIDIVERTLCKFQRVENYHATDSRGPTIVINEVENRWEIVGLFVRSRCGINRNNGTCLELLKDNPWVFIR